LDAVEQHLDYSAFELTIEWGLSARIVRRAFSLVWSGNCSAYLRVSAAARFYDWALRCSPAEIPKAERVVAAAKLLLLDVHDPLNRQNLERMLRVLTAR
jgi:hypothetical protein